LSSLLANSSTTFAWLSKAASPSNSSVVWAATCLPPKTSLPSSNTRSPTPSPTHIAWRRYSSMASYAPTHQRAAAFYHTFDRKASLNHKPPIAPGGGPAIGHKLLARATAELGVQARPVLITPVGCSVSGYYYSDAGNIQAPHGRAPAAAPAVKRSRPDSIV